MRKGRLDAGTVVVVVRNPWDRLVSTWAYYRSRKASWCPENFRDFVLNTSWGNAKRLQTSFFPPHAMILRFENLATDFSKVQSLCNSNEPLVTKNVSNHKHYTEYYDDETINEVYRRQLKDINLLNYSYENNA